MPARVGTKLYGYLSHDDVSDTKRIEAIGADWIVCRGRYGHASYHEFLDGEGLEDWVEEHSRNPEEGKNDEEIDTKGANT